MHWLWATILGLVYIGSYLAGLALRRARATGVYWAFGVCFVLIALRVLFHCLPSVECLLSPYYVYTVIQPWWPQIVAFMLLGIGTVKMTRFWRQVLVAACAAVLFSVMAQAITARVMFDPSDCTGVPDKEGICPQTTSFTCGAAAASTLLAQFGIDSDEKEMALLCWTNEFNGTECWPICKALHQKLAGTPYRPRILLGDWEVLRRRGGPVVVTKRLHAKCDHWLVVLDTTDTHVTVADPNMGKHTLSKDDFLESWRGFLIAVEQR